ncbi:MAG: beta-ketoacyl-ACP synthase [Betaproteobacteria bacterium]
MNAKSLYVHASSLVTCCGAGWRAHADALSYARGGLASNDFAPAADIATFIGRVAALDDAQLPPAWSDFDCRNNRLAMLALAQDGLDAAIRAAATRFGAARIGVFVGSSTSGILSTELAARACVASGAALAFDPAFYMARHNMFATARFIRQWCGLSGPAAAISTACSSSAKAFIAARRAIRAGRCDAAVVAGVDSLALSTLYGFRALQLLSTQPCRPFSAERAGISIGEAAAIALVSGETSDVYLAGAGESSDAFHMSTPPADGAGAQRAMRAALADAGIGAHTVDYINLHGTGTLVNDAAEAAAVRAVFGDAAPCSSTKGFTGHTLGAAGAVEALIAVHALRGQCIPANLGGAPVDPALHIAIATSGRAAPMSHALSNSFGFGGSNCALLFARA